MKDRYAIILVAGQGTRMKSKLKKELHPILGRPMIQYVLDALKPTSIKQTVSIVGHSREEVKQTIGD
ncbi:MAG TPA: NTP transferase domain-containing protein, partial [Pseudogracilibacillus sp.]|nr:NTP transferase domain-containing protein [Pseudogracilibacillus sp.]